MYNKDLAVRKTYNGRYVIKSNQTKPTNQPIKNLQGCPRGVMVKAMDCGIVARMFELQSLYYIHF